MECNTYMTLERESEGKFVDRKSRFLSFALPVSSAEEAELFIKQYKKKYYDARHVCYAYVLEPDGSVMKSSDNGEPSGTAGRPMLGVLRSQNLTYTLLVVVRYFGGIKLGTPGLIAAYRAASESALASARKVERIVEKRVRFQFPYMQMDQVMQLLKKYCLRVAQSEMDNDCRYVVNIPNEVYAAVLEQLSKISNLKILEA
jgi:uncharacterized YigZ family protein